MALAPILARLERHSLERKFALFLEAEPAKKPAESVTAVKFDLPWSNPPNQVSPVKPSQTQSNEKWRFDSKMETAACH